MDKRLVKQKKPTYHKKEYIRKEKIDMCDLMKATSDGMRELEVYHDESYRKGKQWFMVGLLWINSRQRHRIAEGLQRSREYNCYYGRIHYRTLTDHSSKRKTAIEWFRIATDHLRDNLQFYLLAVDRTHPKYEYTRFGCRFHEYNRLTSIALFTSYRWFFPRNLPSRIVFLSDSKTRRPVGDETGNGIITDNFEEYLPRRFASDISKKQRTTDIPLLKDHPQDSIKYTLLSHIAGVRTIDARNEHVEERPEEEEMIQLCDLLLGSFGSAMLEPFPLRAKRVKRSMCMKAKKLIEDLEKEPWKQKYHLHKRLSVGYFPDDQGKIYQRKAPSSSEKETSLTEWITCTDP